MWFHPPSGGLKYLCTVLIEFYMSTESTPVTCPTV